MTTEELIAARRAEPWREALRKSKKNVLTRQTICDIIKLFVIWKMIATLHQDFLVDRLIFPSKVVMIQVNIHVVEILRIRKRLIGKQVIHIKRVLRQFYP